MLKYTGVGIQGCDITIKPDSCEYFYEMELYNGYDSDCFIIDGNGIRETDE